MALNEFFELSSGHKMPSVGIGTWKICDEDEVVRVITDAVRLGYRLIDTAHEYRNERFIGSALRSLEEDGVIKREEIFITSKLWCTQHDDVEGALRGTLSDLGTNYLDLYLVHYPVTIRKSCDGASSIVEKFDPMFVWKQMEKLVEKGLVRSIGLSNFGISNLNVILENCKVRPSVLQIEVHPFFKQKELVKECVDRGIQVTSFSSLGSSCHDKSQPRTIDNSVIRSIASRRGLSPSQVVLSYLVQNGIAVIPKSVNRAHMKENLSLAELSDEDVSDIDKIKDTGIRYVSATSLGPDAFK